MVAVFVVLLVCISLIICDFRPKFGEIGFIFLHFVKIEMRASAEFAFAGQNGRCGWLSEKDVINQFFLI